MHGMTVLLVGVGGFFGAVARYLLDSAIGGRFPWGILVVNVSGSFAVGLLFALVAERGVIADSVRAPVMVGFIGAFTTFSTLALDTWRLAEGGSVPLALANIVGSAVLGLVAVGLGLAVGRLA